MSLSTIPDVAASLYASGVRFATVTDEECQEALALAGFPDHDANVWALLTALTNCRLADLLDER